MVGTVAVRQDTELLVTITVLGIAGALAVTRWDVHPVTVVLTAVAVMIVPPALWAGIRHRRSTLDNLFEAALNYWGVLGGFVGAGLILYGLYAVGEWIFRLVF